MSETGFLQKTLWTAVILLATAGWLQAAAVDRLDSWQPGDWPFSGSKQGIADYLKKATTSDLEPGLIKKINAVGRQFTADMPVWREAQRDQELRKHRNFAAFDQEMKKYQAVRKHITIYIQRDFTPFIHARNVSVQRDGTALLVDNQVARPRLLTLNEPQMKKMQRYITQVAPLLGGDEDDLGRSIIEQANTMITASRNSARILEERAPKANRWQQSGSGTYKPPEKKQMGEKKETGRQGPEDKWPQKMQKKTEGTRAKDNPAETVKKNIDLTKAPQNRQKKATGQTRRPDSKPVKAVSKGEQYHPEAIKIRGQKGILKKVVLSYRDDIKKSVSNVIDISPLQETEMEEVVEGRDRKKRTVTGVLLAKEKGRYARYNFEVILISTKGSKVTEYTSRVFHRVLVAEENIVVECRE
ncbi:MAG: hypothetical protein CSB24_00420 [Deltaproteobacteria bacterium]|nr:MAG: hypothetical protein CSB24_00420 [Deltaproteobacteria bacterium]